MMGYEHYAYDDFLDFEPPAYLYKDDVLEGIKYVLCNSAAKRASFKPLWSAYKRLVRDKRKHTLSLFSIWVQDRMLHANFIYAYDYYTGLNTRYI